jgi:zinc transporter, ZIP family
MDLGKTLILGFIAGVTIVLGLPVGRLRRSLPSVRLTPSPSRSES